MPKFRKSLMGEQIIGKPVLRCPFFPLGPQIDRAAPRNRFAVDLPDLRKRPVCKHLRKRPFRALSQPIVRSRQAGRARLGTAANSPTPRPAHAPSSAASGPRCARGNAHTPLPPDYCTTCIAQPRSARPGRRARSCGDLRSTCPHPRWACRTNGTDPQPAI